MNRSGRAALSVLLARMAGGDRSVQREVFDAVWPVMREFCRRYLGGPGDAEDAAQQAVIRMFEQAADYDVTRDGLAWALEISLWECRTLTRRRQRSREGALSAVALAVADGAPGPDAEAERRDLEAALGSALQDLSDDDRRALVGGLTGAEAGIAPATWRKRRERALSRLKLLWRTQHES